MQVLVTVANEDDPFATGSLFGWLQESMPLARSGSKVTLSTQDSGQGSMGALEIISVVLSHAVGVASFLVSFAGWWQSRPQGATVRFAINGVEITARDSSPETLAAVERAIRAAWPEESDHAA